MSVSETSPTTRRELHFDSPEQVLRDVEQLASGTYHTLGKWTFGQILDHLATAIDGFYDGFGFQAPWYARVLIAPLVKKSVLKKMSAGFQLPKQAESLLPSVEISTTEGLNHFRTSLNRLQKESLTHPHPFFGKMKPDEVCQLMLRHAEMHLSFVVPD